MYVKDIEDGVCGFYATLHTEYTGPLQGEGYLFEPSALWV